MRDPLIAAAEARIADICDFVIERNHSMRSKPDNPAPSPSSPHTRTFQSGALRSADADRDDPEGCLSPLVIDRYAEYLHKHSVLPDGSRRASDNWQLGMSKESYIKGAWRHLLHWWTRHRGFPVRDPKAAANTEEDLCALIFNASGYLHTLVKERVERERDHIDGKSGVDVSGHCYPPDIYGDHRSF